MRTQKVLLFILFFLLIFGGKSTATVFLDVKTGGEQSASWAYTEELTKIWNSRFQDDPIIFSPNESENWEDRLNSLIKGYSRFMIAPLKDESSDFFQEQKLRIVSTLWRVYLVPISLVYQDLGIGEGTHKPWNVPENSVIIPTFFKLKNQLQPEEVQPQDQPQSSETESQDQPQSSEILPQVQPQSSETHLINQSLQELLQQKYQPKPDEYRIIKRDELSPIDVEMMQGVLFVEIAGPIEKLMEKISENFSVFGLNNNFRTKLLTELPWLDETYFTYKNNKRRDTVRYTMALYTMKNEDSEFIEKLAELIASPPNTSFPYPYLIEHRSTSETKELSPALLHEGTRNYYKIEYTPPIEPMEEALDNPIDEEKE